MLKRIKKITMPNIKLLLHPGSLEQIVYWLDKENAPLTPKDMDQMALESIISSHNSNTEPDYEVALKVFNSKLKEHIKANK